MSRGSVAGRSEAGSEGSYAAGSSVSRHYEAESEHRQRAGSVSGADGRGGGQYYRGGESSQGQGSYGSSSTYGSESGHRSSSTYGSASSQGSSSAQGSASGHGSASGQGSRTYEGHSAGASSGSSAHDSRRNYDSNAGSSGTQYDLRRTYEANAGSTGTSQFDALAGIAQGPRDGVARTYTFDVANDNDRGSSRASQHGTIAGIAAGAAQAGGGSAQQYGNSSSSSHRSSWSSSSGGGRHYVSGAQNSEERDNVDYDTTQDKDRRYQAGRDNVDYDNVDRQGSSWSSLSSWQSKSGSYNNAGRHPGDNVVEHEEPGLQQKFRLYPRYRRQADDTQDSLEDMDCGPVTCSRVRCVVGPLSKDQEAWIAFRSRLWVQTLKKFAYHPEVQLSSMMAGRVSKLPHIGAPDQSAVHTHEVVTTVVPRDTGARPEVVPLWVVVLSACAGALILMLLVYLLYKCGFFKRNRPSSNVPEKQPLNRNGHYQSGDEAL